ncbi:MAG: ABC transporter ATP-binding protein [Candidatus Auribacterota bacterium]|jgi:ABC-2 type transport system ATP-binding protein|nr:ABC transporter ATP-binding protein [Candidatus Auribacterota bacterium]
MSQPDNAVIRTKDLTKIFKDFWGRPRVKAVDNLTLEITKGEVFGLLGPNGSGKSTTLKMLLGLLFPTGGKIAILGKPVSNVAIKQRIGFLPEESYLYGYLTAQETLEFYGKLFDIPAKERKKRTDKLLDMVGLGRVGQRPVREFSKGMTRRLGLAQALINDPDLIFLDEPTSGLDPIGTRQIKDLIIELKNNGKTILLCSHLLADVEDVCDRIAILYGGKIKVCGKVGDLLKKHDALYVNLPQLKQSTIDAIKKIISDSENNAEITVEHPTDRLENFFLKIVQQAVDDKEETSGADVIRQDKSSAQSKADKPADPQINKEIIKKLLNKKD